MLLAHKVPLYNPPDEALPDLAGTQMLQMRAMAQHARTMGKVLDAIEDADLIGYWKRLATESKHEGVRRRAMRMLARWGCLGQMPKLVGTETAANQTVNIILPSAEQAREILERLAGQGKSRMASEQAKEAEIEP